jgi:hypothetical protein
MSITNTHNVTLERLNSTLFTWQEWRMGADWVTEFGFRCRYNNLVSDYGKRIMRQYAVGYAKGESLPCRPKAEHVGVMFYKNDRYFWSHVSNKAFMEIWKN